MSRIRNLGLIFSSPSTVARNIAEDPHWLIPLIVIAVVAYLATVATFDYNMDAQRQVAGERMREMGRDEADMEEYFTPTAAKRYLGSLLPPIGMGIYILVVAAILNGVSSLAGGKAGFRRMFAFYAYAAVISAVGSLVKIPLVFAKQSIDVRTSLAAFVPGLSLQSPLFALLNAFEVFSLWQVAATVIGFNVLTGLGMKKSAVIVVGLWVVYVAITVGLSFVWARFLG